MMYLERAVVLAGSRQIIKLIKYYPVICNVYILLSILFNLFLIHDGLDIYLYTFIGQCFYTNVLNLFLSIKCRFCIWHRLLIYNMSFCLLLETIHNYGINISNHIYIVVLSTIITIFMAIILFIKHGTFNKKKTNNSLQVSNKAN